MISTVAARYVSRLHPVAAAHAQRWAIVLAGGEGKRMQGFIGAWLGESRPKQYCTFVGSRTMIAHTYDRARAVVAPECIATIIARGHRNYLDDAVRNVPGKVIEQPRDAGTAAGILLPLAYILEQDPEATVLLLPSDHFVFPEEWFCNYAAYACEIAEQYEEQMVCLAAIPDRDETDYGWIGLGGPQRVQPRRHRQMTFSPTGGVHVPALCLRKAACFREKPHPLTAMRMRADGGLWSTMVLAAKGKALWAAAHACLPDVMPNFDAFLQVLRGIRAGQLRPEHETEILDRMYKDLPAADFSAGILEHTADRCTVLPMHGVTWCDWGRPERVTETLARLGKIPAFPVAHAAPVHERPALTLEYAAALS